MGKGNRQFLTFCFDCDSIYHIPITLSSDDYNQIPIMDCTFFNTFRSLA